MYGIFQGQNRQRHSFYILAYGVSTSVNVLKCFTGKGYGLVVLMECSTEAILIGICLQNKGLCVVIICQSGPEKHDANPELQAVKCLVCGGSSPNLLYAP